MSEPRTLDVPHKVVYVVAEMAQAKQRPQLTLLRILGVFKDPKQAERCKATQPASQIIEGYEAYSTIRIMQAPLL